MPTLTDIERYRSMLNKATKSRYYAETILEPSNGGVVVRAFDAVARQQVAIKFVQGCKKQEALESEVCNHRALRHPHIIRFKRVFEVEGTLAIVMEFVNSSNLRQEVRKHRRLSEDAARWIFQQLILAVDYCHKKGIASVDIKMDTILLVQGQQQRLPLVKLSDFTQSILLSTTATSQEGSLDFLAPEVLENSNEKGFDKRKADVWSCGTVLYVMLVGYYPFTSSSSSSKNENMSHTTKEMIRSKILKLDYTLPSYLSSPVKKLITSILTTVDQRYSLDRILKDPWFLTYFPDKAKTMNDEILRSEKKRRLNKSSTDYQTDSEIFAIIKKVSRKREDACFFQHSVIKPTEIISDSQIDAEFDEDILQHGNS
eukprot:g4076.t1